MEDLNTQYRSDASAGLMEDAADGKLHLLVCYHSHKSLIVCAGPAGTENHEFMMQNADRPSMCIEGLGPRLALKRLAPDLNDRTAKRQWVEQARLKALLGSCPKTRKSVLSGMRCWCSLGRAPESKGCDSQEKSF